MKHIRSINPGTNTDGPIPETLKTTETGNARIRVRFQGEGAPVVFLHSSARDSRQWRDYAADWSGRHQVVLPDLPGCGDSDDFEPDNPSTLEADANAVNAIADRLKQPLHLIGHSYGGAVALKSAMHLGPRLASLTLIEPTSFHLLRHGDRFEQDMFDRIAGFAAFIEQAVMSGFDEIAMMRFVDFWSKSGCWAEVPATKRAALVPRVHKLPGDFRRLFNDPLHPADIAKLVVPTLVICGTQSPEPVRALSRLIAKSIVQSRHRTIGWAGHMLPLTHYDQVNVLLKEHVMMSAIAVAD